MLMLVIGALLIGYLIYFAATSFRNGASRRAVYRPGDTVDRNADAALAHLDQAGDHVAKLEARITVLERVIADGPPSPAAGPSKPVPPVDGPDDRAPEDR